MTTASPAPDRRHIPRRSLSVVLAALWLAMTLTLAGCPQPAATPAPAVARTKSTAARPQAAKQVRTTAPPVILLSDASRTYRALAELLSKQLGATQSVTLHGSGVNLNDTLPAGNGPLIAVGLEAAIAACSQLQQREVIFALVFNHGDHRLLSQGMTGVSMLPPPRQILRTLKLLSPNTTRVVLPRGQNLEEYTALAHREATSLGLTLVSDTIRNDKELLRMVKRLDRSDAALWLLPDNRIVSRESLQQLMANNLKSGRPTLVFSPSLFPIGGLISAEYDLGAVAETISGFLQKTPTERARLKGTMLHPPRSTISINGPLAAALGLTVPDQLKPLLQGPQ